MDKFIVLIADDLGEPDSELEKGSKWSGMGADGLMDGEFVLVAIALCWKAGYLYWIVMILRTWCLKNKYFEWIYYSRFKT